MNTCYSPQLQKRERVSNARVAYGPFSPPQAVKGRAHETTLGNGCFVPGIHFALCKKVVLFLEVKNVLGASFAKRERSSRVGWFWGQALVIMKGFAFLRGLLAWAQESGHFGAPLFREESLMKTTLDAKTRLHMRSPKCLFTVAWLLDSPYSAKLPFPM